MTWRTFFRLVPGRGIRDPVAAWLTGKGIDHQVRRAHQPGVHGRGGLERQEFVHQRRVNTAAKLGHALGQHELPWGAVDLDVPNPPCLPHRQIGPQLVTALFLRAVQLMVE